MAALSEGPVSQEGSFELAAGGGDVDVDVVMGAVDGCCWRNTAGLEASLGILAGLSLRERRQGEVRYLRQHRPAVDPIYMRLGRVGIYGWGGVGAELSEVSGVVICCGGEAVHNRASRHYIPLFVSQRSHQIWDATIN